MTSSSFAALKMDERLDKKANLKIIKEDSRSDVQSKKSWMCLASIEFFRVFAKCLKSKTKNDLTYERWLRLESKPTRRSYYK